MEQEIALARRIAEQAHEGQVDKAGARYIDHPRRVSARVRAFGGSAEAVAAAWLHDVVEDTEWTLDRVREAGISERTCDLVELMTKREGLTAEEYFAQLRAHEQGRIVKLADICDNTDPARVEKLDAATRERLRAKYRRSLALLFGDD